MKSLLLVGGMLGMGVGMGASSLQGNAWPVCLWHGCLAAYLSALLLRWWGRTWRKSLQQSIQERENAENALPPATLTPKPSKS